MDAIEIFQHFLAVSRMGYRHYNNYMLILTTLKKKERFDLTLSLPLGHHMRSAAKYRVCSLYATIGC